MTLRRLASRLVVPGIVLLVASFVRAQSVVYVNAAASGANDGSSWENAFTTVQAGIDAPGWEVWVAAGTYQENIRISSAGVALYGGFAGIETAREQRDFRSHLTILDGRGAGSVIYMGSWVTLGTRVDGFTITNGTGTGSASSALGGGIHLQTCSPIIANNLIVGNRATAGAGIWAYYAEATLVNNVVVGNTGDGGIYCWGRSPALVNNTIIGNDVGIVGYESSATVVNNLVVRNTVGVRTLDSPNLMLAHNCVFANPFGNYRDLPDPTGTNGNLSVEPLVAGAEFGRFHLQPGSPCCDAGDDSVILADWLDIDAQPRLQNGHVDIGADESDGTIWPTSPPRIVRVATSGDDVHDGSTWNVPKRSIQSAIDAAAVTGGEVWVQEGTYYEGVTIPPYVYLYGGFGGFEISREERSWRTRLAVIDAQLGGSVVSFLLGHCVSGVDGLTLTSGNGTPVSSKLLGGGIYCNNSSPFIANCVVSGNSATTGGGIYAGAGSLLLVGSMVSHNAAFEAGGMFVGGSWSRIEGSRIVANTASLRGGGALVANGTVTIHNCLVQGNHAPQAAGLYIWDPWGPVSITNCTVIGNRAAGGHGGGIQFYITQATLANSILARNSSGVRASGPTLPQLSYNLVSGNTEFDYSGLPNPTGTHGNISEEPRFAAQPDPGPDGLWATDDDIPGDLHLRPGSPCVDAASNGLADGDTDLDGLVRALDGDEDGSAVVDMGAFEFVPGDQDVDGDADLADYASWADCLAGPLVFPTQPCPLADFDGDGDVDLADFARMQRILVRPAAR